MQQMPEVLQALRNEGLHSLSEARNPAARDRYNIYEAFGITNYPATYQEAESRLEGLANFNLVLTEADKTFCQLSIITAQHVIPIWEEIVFNEYGADKTYQWLYTLPSRLLELAANLLTGTVNPKVSFRKVFYDYYNNIVGHVDSEVNQKAWYVCNCAYSALSSIFLGYQSLQYEGECLQFGDFEAHRCNDVARLAMLAFSAIDENEPGNRVFLERVNRYKPIQYNAKNQVAFWSWWLTEAIPQAWELGHPTLDNKTSL